MREVTDRQKDRHTDTGDFIICPMLCYRPSNGTDKNTKQQSGRIIIIRAFAQKIAYMHNMITVAVG